jgi:hypothetical protein
VRFVNRTTHVVNSGPANPPARISPISYRWALSEQSLQLLPPATDRRSFKWSYIFARALRRLNPGSYFG